MERTANGGARITMQEVLEAAERTEKQEAEKMTSTKMPTQGEVNEQKWAEIAEAEKAMAMESCPACGCSQRYSAAILYNNDRFGQGARRCRRCAAVYGGTLYRGEYLKGWGRNGRVNFCTCARGPEALRYVELTILGSEGVERIHGWACQEGWHQIG